MVLRVLPLACLLLLMGRAVAESGTAPPQYAHGDITIPAAAADEALRSFSSRAAFDYLEKGAVAWSRQRQCVSCHTNGTYLLTAPSLVHEGGTADEGMRRFFVEELEHHELASKKELKSGLRPTELAYIAAGLAQWDQHLSKERSPETARALTLMFEAQGDDGSYGNLDCWPPLESSRFHGATVALMAAVAAPGWVGSEGSAVQEKWKQLVAFLQEATPANDYQRVLLLWASARYPGLLDQERKAALVRMIRKHQQPDGGWSIRHFASPESWGSGNRAEKLRAEVEFETPPSDGHMTGLALIVLRESGVAIDDPEIAKAVDWLKTNQRESGRWWTRSLNTDKFHLITYSGTAYPLLALSLCGELD